MPLPSNSLGDKAAVPTKLTAKNKKTGETNTKTSTFTLVKEDGKWVISDGGNMFEN